MSSCASSYVGSFSGTDNDGAPHQGRFVAQVLLEDDLQSASMSFLFYFELNDMEFNGEAAVDAAGTITPVGALALTGALDLDNCEGSGTWSFNVLGEGTWQMDLP